MKKLLVVLCMAVIIFGALETATAVPIVWTGPEITFTKVSYADWTLEANQDRITDNVWITRQTTQGIYNIKTEGSYTDFHSPKDTEWAYGSASTWASLTFNNWEDWNGSYPPGMVGKDAVLHLISDDIYLDIKFLSWTSGGAGGGFSYERSTAPDPIPEPSTWLLLCLGLIGIVGIKKKFS